MRLSHILEGSSLRRPRVVRQRRVINGRLVSGKLRILDENGRKKGHACADVLYRRVMCGEKGIRCTRNQRVPAGPT